LPALEEGEECDVECEASRQKEALQLAQDFRKTWRQQMKQADKKREQAYDDFGELSGEYVEAETDYYVLFAKVEVLTDLVTEVRIAARKAQKKVDEARLGGGISDYDRRDLLEKIENARA